MMGISLNLRLIYFFRNFVEDSYLHAFYNYLKIKYL